MSTGPWERRAAGGGDDGAVGAVHGAASPADGPVVATADRTVHPTVVGPGTPAPADDVDHQRPHRYTGKHYVALAVAACALGFLLWSLLTDASGSGAPGAAAAHPTMSLSPGAALRGDL